MTGEIISLFVGRRDRSVIGRWRQEGHDIGATAAAVPRIHGTLQDRVATIPRPGSDQSSLNFGSCENGSTSSRACPPAPVTVLVANGTKGEIVKAADDEAARGGGRPTRSPSPSSVRKPIARGHRPPPNSSFWTRAGAHHRSGVSRKQTPARRVRPRGVDRPHAQPAIVSSHPSTEHF